MGCFTWIINRDGETDTFSQSIQDNTYINNNPTFNYSSIDLIYNAIAISNLHTAVCGHFIYGNSVAKSSIKQYCSFPGGQGCLCP